MINDIIDVSKIEANELKLKYVDCHLKRIIDNIEATFNEVKKQKGKAHIILSSEVPSQYADLVISTDAVRLEQVLSNLIGNALKFTCKGTIKFGFKVSSKDRLTFFVSDTGTGIPKDKLNDIFNRFEQLETRTDKMHEGTGLGLSISRGIVNLLKGKLTVDSEIDKGTTFAFTIPLIKNTSSLVTKDNTTSTVRGLEGMKLLVVDDEPVNIEFFRALFDKLPVTVIYASNGAEALSYYKQDAEIKVVLMDIRMPIMNGIEAAKKMFEINPKALIIAQTAYSMTSDRDKYLNMGFVDYISKPIEKEKLLRKLKYLTYKK
ncbi:ATP-binding protein [Lutibacter sp. A80]|uniref:ATP-binding protein n=1 Tax=Lutibacter sp. A80 TaxID=2918453 RepID=UPI001F06373E|nr:ATP-binding protein [Lutibacter sp. A80]UMB61188.1 ATP-binding protein [Lutibacter sp. A80]